jgi:lysophospholipase L1-like esterase
MLRRALRRAIVVPACALLLAGAFAATPKKAKRRVSRAPQVSTSLRAASIRKVNTYLDDPPPRAFEQPGALVPFLERLSRVAAGDESGPVHVLHFGDSHTAADEWTGGLRDSLKERFGDGGPGFVLAGHPFAGYRRFDARGGASTYWHTEGLRSANGDGYFGLGGVSVSSEQAGQSVYLDAECAEIEVDYLRQPGGGSLALDADNEPLQTISTDGELGPGVARVPTLPGPHRFTLRKLDSRPVRLFGWVADKPRGVTYESLGINGAEASVMLKWNEAMLATYLQQRDPGLIVLAYGTNEASDPSWSPETYQPMFSGLLRQIRQAVPAASILVIGPTDRWYRFKGAWRPYPGIDGIITAQKAACRENACAYWDGRSRMGGKGSMRDWVYAGLAQGDFVHFTSAGYRRLAAVLYADLMQQFETYGQAKQNH